MPPDGMQRLPERAGQGLLRRARRRVTAVRDRVKVTPGGRHLYRLIVATVGVAVTLGGLVLVPLPGPGWLIVFVGLAILASEFAWARRARALALARLNDWTRWLGRQAWWVRWLVASATAGVAAAVLYLVALWRGVPSWVPDPVIPPLPGL